MKNTKNSQKAKNPQVLNYIPAPPFKEKVRRMCRNFVILAGLILISSLIAMYAGARLESKAQAAQRVADMSAFTRKVNYIQERNCLAYGAFWEGERGNHADKIYIVHNILERVASGKYPSTICGTVYEMRKNKRTKKETAMYSFIMDGRQDPSLTGHRDWADSLFIAENMLGDWNPDDRTYTFASALRLAVTYSQNYHAEGAMPAWALEANKGLSCELKPIGKHGAHYHYVDFKRADPNGYQACLRKLSKKPVTRA